MAVASRGLTPFTDRVVGDEVPTRPETRPFDLGALVRVLVAIATATFVALTIEGADAFSSIVAVAYVPFVSLAAIHRRTGGRTLVGPVALVDLALVHGAAIAADEPAFLEILGLVLIGVHAWESGRIAGWGLTALLTGGLATISAIDLLHIDPVAIALTAGASIAVVGLLATEARVAQGVSKVWQLSENRANAVLASIGEAVVITDARGRLRSANPAATQVLGVDCDSSAACQHELALHGDHRPLDCSSGCALLRDHRPGASVELWRTGPQGQRQALLAGANPLVDAEGRTVEVVHSFRDISAVRAADEAKSLFLATTSHELKTPLTVIRGFAQMLGRDDIPADARAKAIETIENRTSQLSSIVDRLLLSSRIEAGEIRLETSMSDITGALRRTATDVGASTGRTIDVDITTDRKAWADVDAVITVVEHLLENAAKYSPNGGAIAVGLHDDGNTLRLDVRDEGVGMTPEQIERCFDRFYQGEGTDVRRFGGTGIGLYIVESLVDAMDATIAVTSTPGVGSTFTLNFLATPPIDDVPEVDAPSGGSQVSMIEEFMRQVGAKLPAERGGRS